jgi:hypothetical protein
MVSSSREIAKGEMLQACQGPEEMQTSSKLWHITDSYREENRGCSKCVRQTVEVIWKLSDKKRE